MARTLNNQPVFEYILHCLRTTYKYFALPHRITKSNPPKPLSTVTCISEHSKGVAKHDSAIQAKNDKFKNSVLAQDPGAASASANTCKVQALPLKETAESFGSPRTEETGNTHTSVHAENSDCIKAEVSCDDHEDVKVHHQETGNKTGKEKIEGEGGYPSTADDQGLSSSKHGEPVTSGSTQNAEADSNSALEGFQKPTSKECDGFATLDNRVGVDEESVEGTDELADTLSHFAPSRQGQTSEVLHSDEEEEDDDDDEEPRLSVTQRDDEEDIANEDELDNTYTGSGDEDALSEEDEEVGCGSAKYEEVKECGKEMDGALPLELNKIRLKEENVCGENSPMGPSDFFYEFSKLTFTKGKVGNHCHS